MKSNEDGINSIPKKGKYPKLTICTKYIQQKNIPQYQINKKELIIKSKTTKTSPEKNIKMCFNTNINNKESQNNSNQMDNPLDTKTEELKESAYNKQMTNPNYIREHKKFIRKAILNINLEKEKNDIEEDQPIPSARYSEKRLNEISGISIKSKISNDISQNSYRNITLCPKSMRLKEEGESKTNTKNNTIKSNSIKNKSTVNNQSTSNQKHRSNFSKEKNSKPKEEKIDLERSKDYNKSINKSNQKLNKTNRIIRTEIISDSYKKSESKTKRKKNIFKERIQDKVLAASKIPRPVTDRKDIKDTIPNIPNKTEEKKESKETSKGKESFHKEKMKNLILTNIAKRKMFQRKESISSALNSNTNTNTNSNNYSPAGSFVFIKPRKINLDFSLKNNSNPVSKSKINKKKNNYKGIFSITSKKNSLTRKNSPNNYHSILINNVMRRNNPNVNTIGNKTNLIPEKETTSTLNVINGYFDDLNAHTDRDFINNNLQRHKSNSVSNSILKRITKKSTISDLNNNDIENDIYLKENCQTKKYNENRKMLKKVFELLNPKKEIFNLHTDRIPSSKIIHTEFSYYRNHKSISSLKEPKTDRPFRYSKEKLKTDITNLNKFMQKEESTESMKSTLIKQGVYYSLESEKLSSKIKSYFTHNGQYPQTDMSFYKIGRVIGRGAFGKVNLGLHVLTGRIVAIKSFNKKKITGNYNRQKIKREIRLMQKLRNNSIVRILESIETKDYILIMMEHVAGGDLLSYIKKRGKLNEKTARMIFFQLIRALNFIHSMKIVHRDIKLDNILIDLNNNIKICDFGVGERIEEGKFFINQCGTPAYIAPEIIKNNGYLGPPVDLWSAGVVLYAMLSGKVPFKAHNLEQLNELILKGNYKPIKDISQEASDLIKGLLEINPKKRFTIYDVLKHPWMNAEGSLSNSSCNGGYNPTYLLDSENKGSLFTQAELILLSKLNIDYRNCNNDEIMENFSDSYLITKNDDENQNKKSKSIILAPYNTSCEESSNEDKKEYLESSLSIENGLIKFNSQAKILNRNYELNNNGEIDHGVLIKNTKIKSENKSKENKSKEEEDNFKLLNNISLEENEFNQKDTPEPIFTNSDSERRKTHSKNNSQRNVSSIENSSTLLIDESALKTMESLGYQKDYVKKCLNNNELNYATATYYLLTNFRV
ncbi:MAG: protein kinase [archaeon]|nr:protein kinase [archaeon]